MGGPFLANGLLGAATAVAITAACVALRRARASRSAIDQLRREAAELTRTVEADSRLADGVAHGLIDLLTAITGHAELLVASLGRSSTSIQDVDAIQQAAVDATQLAKSLRTLSSGVRAPADLVDVNATAARTVNVLRSMLGPSINVRLTLREDVKRIHIGAGRLDEILLHLCLHAHDALPNGGLLTLATAMHTRAGRNVPRSARREYVRIVVGLGDPAMAATAQPVPPGPTVSSDEGGFTTLGLSKVATIVEQAGGRSQVSIVAGRWTTFTVDLPAAPGSGTESDRTPDDRPRPAPVLVVEDEPGMRELIRLILVRGGREVVTAAGPRAGLAMLKRHPEISLMLVDIVMPEMDGYEMVAEARKTSAGLRVVFVSAFAPDPKRHPDGDPFFPKPFTSESLTGIVEKALSS